MIRGFVYSISAISLFLLASIVWMTLFPAQEETMVLMGGWILLICFFAVGPLFFALGYWHHCRLHPDDPHWDPELDQ